MKSDYPKLKIIIGFSLCSVLGGCLLDMTIGFNKLISFFNMNVGLGAITSLIVAYFLLPEVKGPHLNLTVI